MNTRYFWLGKIDRLHIYVILKKRMRNGKLGHSFVGFVTNERMTIVKECGQIQNSMYNYIYQPKFKYNEGWNPQKVDRLLEIWNRWHLNDMRAGCKHQRNEKWEERPIDPSKPLSAYGLHYKGQVCASSNRLVWVTRKEHKEGLLSFPCPTCGYKYGTSWLYEALPTEILAELETFPSMDINDVPSIVR